MLIVRPLIALSLISLSVQETTAYEPEYSLDASELSEGLSVRILKFGKQHGRGVTKGNRVKILLRSFSPAVQADLSGLAQQSFEVGKHGIVPLNEAILNMRLDEIRRIGIPFGNYGKIYYEVHLIGIQ